MRTFIFCLAVFPFLALAQDALEEAIILNQELQFLEESVQKTRTTNLPSTSIQRRRVLPQESLERTYFNDANEDAVRTRTAAPKRRRSKE